MRAYTPRCGVRGTVLASFWARVCRGACVASLEIEVTASSTDAEQGVITSGLVAYNELHAGPGSEPLAVLVRDAGRAAVGGLPGGTGRGWLFVRMLWLPEAIRGSGLDSRVIEAAEAEAARRGCAHAHVDTFSFQAPGFYRRHGYEVFGALDDYLAGHRRLFLRKRLRGAAG